MYIFPMLSNPITLHGSVVFLRLYWFEKRFQRLVKDSRQRRIPLTKSKSKAKPGDEHRRAEEGVNGRDITRVTPTGGKPPKLTNDGIVIEGDKFEEPKAVSTSEGSDSTVQEDRPGSIELDPLEKPVEKSVTALERAQEHPVSSPGPTAITFAGTVKRSDGIEDDTNFPAHRTNAEHIAILERQRNQDNEVLRIPGPRETERGYGPQRLDEDDANDDGNTLITARTRESRPSRPENQPFESRNIRSNPTITIEEPERQSRHHGQETVHEVAEKASENTKAIEGVFGTMKMRKPRIFNNKNKKLHEDEGLSRRTKTLDTIRSVLTRDKDTVNMPYLSYTPTIARNSNFVGLTLEQREELGGIEYRSLRTLAFILLGYFWGFQLMALAFLLPFILYNNHYGKIVNDQGISRTWWGFWTPNVAFMDVGFTLTNDSMISFQTSEYALMVMWFFIIIGNTGFPVMLRFIIWVMSKVVPKGTGLWEELRFLLDHPRRCFTLLFPSAATWWLFGILVILNAVDLIFFIILDLNSEVVEKLPVHTRVVNGLFQAASTRTAGFASLPLSELHPAMPVLYMIMMYIGVFPIAISIRRTNVYEERSLGVYHDNKKDDDDENNPQDVTAMSYVGTHLRRQLSFDLWYVFLGFFLLTIAEGSKLKAGKFDIFACLFEIVSAYGTVGMSLGATGINASLCSQFSVVGKLIIILMEIRGRHRGLPYGLDRAVILPSESRFKSDTEEEVEHPTQPPLLPQTTGASAAISAAATRRGSSLRRRSSLGGNAERRMDVITKLLHPGPIVPQGAVHSHSRTRSGGSAGSQDLSYFNTHGSGFSAVIEDDDEEENGEHLAPPRRPRRASTSPALHV